MTDTEQLLQQIRTFRDARDWQQFHNPKDLCHTPFRVFPDQSLFSRKIVKAFECQLRQRQHKKLISPNLFRVQKLSKVMYGNSAVREYVFRHHLETTVEERKELKDITFKNIKSLVYFESVVKVRVNHIGDIVSIGEY